MRAFLIALSGAISIGAVLPYIVEIMRGKTKPRIVSWFTWTLLTAIACAASFDDHQYPAGFLMLFETAGASLVVVLGFKHGDRKFERLDVVSQIGAVVGLLLWAIFNSPTVAVLATVTIDLLGAIPTIKHSWQKPHEEAWITYALSSVAGGLIVLVAQDWRVTAIAYPFYLLTLNAMLTAIILRSPHRKLKGEPAELREF